MKSLAAERRKSEATAEGRGDGVCRRVEPRSGERFFRGSAAHATANLDHGLQPWLRSVAAPRLRKGAPMKKALFFVTLIVLAAMATSAVAQVKNFTPVTQAMLLNPSPDDW